VATETSEFDAIKQTQRQMWSAGDYALHATPYVIIDERLCEAVDILPGERVLDVACGSGNATLAAARRAMGGTVGVDYVPDHFEHARARAAAERLDIEWVEGDAEDLPFEDGSFDVVLSAFGAMFTPNQERTAAELLRVCRPGGRIGMANWTPDGLPGQALATVARYGPAPPGVPPPTVWGTTSRLRELFGDQVSELAAPRRVFTLRHFSPQAWLEFSRTYFGPVKFTFESLDEAAQDALAADLIALLERFNEAGERALAAPAEYLEVVATRA
jgi:ubiquinone/menaquinone biosynthesis C-methylase UbiE